MPNQTIDVGTVLNFVRPSLRSEKINYFNVVESTLGRMAEAQLLGVPANARTYGFYQTIAQQDPLHAEIVEAFHYLLHNGLITRAPTPPNFPSQTNDFIVTRRGQEWAAGDNPIPEDSRNYVAVLTSLVPNLDPIIRQYVEEALIAYQRQAYFAAAVMIGAASEKAIYLLADALLRAVQSAQEQRGLADSLQRRSLRSLFDAIQEMLNLKRKQIPYAATEGAEQHLLSFFESIRVQRNEAVHPHAAQVTPGKVQLSLSAFPHACQKLYTLMDWLQKNSI